MSLSLTQTAVNLITSAGYAGLALGLIIDSAGIPVPSEVLIPLAAVSAKQGSFNIILVVIVSTLAQTLGALIAYEIGRRGGLPLLHKYGKYVLISSHDLEITHKQFQKRGQLLAFWGRCIPVVRGYIGFVAGIADMPLRTFITASFFGSLMWTIILAITGYLVADDVAIIDRAVRPFSMIIIAAVLIAVAWFIIHRIRSNKKAIK